MEKANYYNLVMKVAEDKVLQSNILLPIKRMREDLAGKIDGAYAFVKAKEKAVNTSDEGSTFYNKAKEIIRYLTQLKGFDSFVDGIIPYYKNNNFKGALVN
jgi:hypothetical protein